MSKENRALGRAERAAAVRAEQARKERTRRVALIAGIVVLLGAIIAAGAWYGSGADKPASSAVSATLAVGNDSLVMGDADAPVKVVIYEDFLCPFCRELEMSTRDLLREDAAKGKVQVEYRPINLLTNYDYSAKTLNAWAAVLQHATPAAALKLHDLFYDKQPYEQSSNEITDSQIAAWVKQAGGDNAAVREAMKTKDVAFFTAVSKAMTDANVEGTPTVFVNGTELTATSMPEVVQQLETAIDEGGK
jgi:protein-disulfide isomerase